MNLVTDLGRIDDGTFNQPSYDAMIAAADCFGFETDYIETSSEADYARNIATSLSSDPNVVITSGVTVGERCVIGANSVVTRDLPPRSIAGGAPARVLKTIA